MPAIVRRVCVAHRLSHSPSCRDRGRDYRLRHARGASLRETRLAARMLDSSRFARIRHNLSARRTSRRSLRLAVVILVSLFANLGAIGLVGPDEPRYAWIARAMAETGDWVTPRLWGVPWFEKPVLYYWAAAIGFWIHLPAEWAARLPSAFAALAAAIAIAWFARRHYGSRRRFARKPDAARARDSSATSVAAIGFARAATPDMLFSAAITLAMVCAASVLRRGGALRVPNNASADNQTSQSADAAVVGSVSRRRRACERSRGRNTCGRRRQHLGARDIPVARSNPPGASARHRGLLCRRAAVVRALRATQSRLPARFYFSAQFRTLPDAALSAPAALLVLRTHHNSRAATVVCIPDRRSTRSAKALARKILEKFSRILRRLLGRLPHRVLQLLAIEAAELHSPGRSRPRAGCRNQRQPRVSKKSLQRDHPERRNRRWCGLCWPRCSCTQRTSSHSRSWAAPSQRSRWLAPGIAIVSPREFSTPECARIFRLAVILCSLCAVATLETRQHRSPAVARPLCLGQAARRVLAATIFIPTNLHLQLRRTWNYGLAFYFHREIPEWSPQDPDAALVLTSPRGI